MSITVLFTEFISEHFDNHDPRMDKSDKGVSIPDFFHSVRETLFDVIFFLARKK